jgi:ProP effector
MNDTAESSLSTDPAAPAAEAPVVAASPTEPPQHVNNQDQGQRQSNGQANPQKKKVPRARGPNPVLEKLFELYPQLFGARFLPLKLGVFQELMARHPEAFVKDELKVAMGLHARSTRYLESVAAGHPRHDLDGQPVEPVAPEHVHHAIMELHRRRQQRTPDDLSGELRNRLARAIDESGLSRETYAERTRTQDEGHNAMLDSALAEHAGIVARREALLRAFEASGKTEAEFADMYGMDPREVGRTLKRARMPIAATAADAPESTPASESKAD